MSDVGSIDFIMRLVIAVVFGFCIGLERELTNKYAGLRTHIMVCLGACIFTLISIYGFPTFAPGDNVIVDHATGIRDTGRVAAQIVTGIGFIGAGTVLRNGPIVLGLTTAATLWIAASVGMACGAGMYDIACTGTLLAILVLVIIRVFEKTILPKSTKRTKPVKVKILCSEDVGEEIYSYIVNKFQEVTEITKRKLQAESSGVKISCVLNVPANQQIKEMYKLFQDFETESISVQEYKES